MRRLRTLLLTAMVVLGLLSTPLAASAVDFIDPACKGEAAVSEYCKQAQSSKGKNAVLGGDGIFVKIMRLMIMISGVISVIMVVIGGIKYVTSNGDPKGAQSAKNTILYAIIGLVLTLLAATIVAFVASRV